MATGLGPPIPRSEFLQSQFILLSFCIAMGLDIFYFKNIELIEKPSVKNDSEDSEDSDDSEDDEDESTSLYQAKGFERRGDHLVAGKYKAKERGSFRMGYGHHMRFRCNLYKAIGGKKWKDMGFCEQFPDVEDGEPFAELIMMSDCEGFIGPITSEKLYQDFMRYTTEAEKNLLEEGDLYLYNEWKKAFKCARHNGVVQFC